MCQDLRRMSFRNPGKISDDNNDYQDRINLTDRDKIQIGSFSQQDRRYNRQGLELKVIPGHKKNKDKKNLHLITKIKKLIVRLIIT